jgi:diguanylate cyclase (GGDEF)-like protein
LLVNIVITILNLFTPLVFHIDDANAYHRGPFFGVYLAVFYIYLLWAVVIVVAKLRRSRFPAERRDLWILVLFSVPPILGSIVQSIFYGTSFTWPSTVISFVIVYIYVLNRQISTDALTGLNNRRLLRRFLDLKTTSADLEPSLFLIMLDADDFKFINDTYGHAVGDRALTQIARILKDMCNHRDCFLARLGGDEFVIAGHDGENSMLEYLLAEIDARIAAFNASGAEPYQLALSVGTARFVPGSVDTTDALLVSADRSMYLAKANRKLARQVYPTMQG